MFVKRKAFVFYFGQRAGIASWKMIARHPRGSGNESFRRRGAGLVQPESLNRGTRGRENGVLPECRHTKEGERNSVPDARGMKSKNFSGIPRANRETKVSACQAQSFFRSRSARVVSNRFSKNNPRAYTPVIATVPIFNIQTRFCKTLLSRCILSFPPRPSHPVGAGGVLP